MRSHVLPTSGTAVSRRPTSRDVARIAGVSRTTVSLVLNGKRLGSIPLATRQRVLDAARTLGYVPDAAGRSLVSGRTGTLALVVGHARHLAVDGFLPQVLTALNETAHTAGYHVLVDAVDDPRRPDAYFARVRAGRVDGLVVVNPRSDDAALEALLESGFPVAVIGNVPGFEGACSACHDLHGGRLVAEHLLRLGRRRIAYLGFAPPTFRASAERLEGLRATLDASGVELSEARLRHAAFSAQSGYRETAAWLRDGVRFDALFAGNDTVAFGALAALREHGLQVPADVAVIGFDDLPLARFALPRLSSVRSHPAEHGRRAARALIAGIEGRPAPDEPPLPPRLIVRRSCGAVHRPADRPATDRPATGKETP